MTPYYQDDFCAIYHGDCREVLLPWIDGLAGLILTDPPYGINLPTDYRKRGRGKLALPTDYAPVHGDTEPFDPGWVLALGLPAILWGANYYADRLPTTSGWLVWDKQRPKGIDQADVELAWSNCVKGARIFHHLWHGMMRASERKTHFHPTQKPVALMAWCLGLKGAPEGTVLDPYMGAGPVLLAAKEAGRKSIGIEIEEQYCERAANRLSQEVLW